MSEAPRYFLRVFIWVALVCSFLVDGAIGDYAITGGDVIRVVDGRWASPGGDPSMWAWAGGFVIAQGLLILALIRLRTPRAPIIFLANHSN